VKTDWIFIITVAFLAFTGLLMMVSLGYRDPVPLFWFWRQLAWLGISLVAAVAAANFDYRVFRNSTTAVMAVYLIAIMLLAATLFWGVRINGAKSWLALGGALFQPVEVAKIALILILAKYYAVKNIELWRFRHIMITGMYLAIPALLVMVQPDLGSVVILFAIWFGMTMVSGIRRPQLFTLIFLVLSLGAFLWTFILNDIQKNRVFAVIRPEAVSSAALYNVRQAVIAVGAGGLFGQGFGEGSQAQLKFLPAAKTDFIFAALVEELGAIGGLLVLAAIGVMLWGVIALAISVENNFAKLFCVGFFLMIFTHTLVNVAMNLGIFPVIGIPLPFVSYGGSNLLANFIGLGILLSIRRHTFSYKAEHYE
jgi:rod shape determining protein RodA